METENMENAELQNIQSINLTEEHFDSGSQEELLADANKPVTFEKDWETRYVDLTELTEWENREIEELEINEEEMSLEAQIPSLEDLDYPEVLQMELDYFHDEDQEDKLWQAERDLIKILFVARLKLLFL